MIPGARLIILGRQGAGKGTQCVRLSRHFVVPHISTGDMLRTAVREGTELGAMAKQVMDAGGLVGDEIMIGLVDQRLSALDASTRGYILDGFPRTIEQADALDRIAADRPIDVVLDLERSPRNRARADLGAPCVPRLRDQLHRGRSVPSPWICDVCGGDVKQRADDTPESVNRRLDLYEEQTFPLIKHYNDQRRLVVVNGIGHPDDVFDRLVKAVEANRN